MRLDTYISQKRIVDISSDTLEGALKELLDTISFEDDKDIKKEDLLEGLLQREATMTTYLGKGVALPHLRVPLKRRYILAVGRCPAGLEHNGQREYSEIRHLFLFLAHPSARNYLSVLATLARLFQDLQVMERLNGATKLAPYRQAVREILGGKGTKTAAQDNKFNRLILKEAEMIAKGAKCSAILVFGDTFAGGIEISRKFNGFKTVLITQGGSSDLGADKANVDAVLPIRSFSASRLAQLRSAVLIGLTRGIFQPDWRLCCIGGLPQSNQFDSLVVVDIEREFRNLLSIDAKVLPSNVRPETVERIIAIATELAVEGREGRPVGCLFVLGETQAILPFTKPLVLNPFYGYKDEDRNVLNPFMDETVKELSTIDGAFVVRGDGVLESAGSLIHAPDYAHDLPSGLGSRHAAAAAITLACDCISIVVSGSTGQVTLFRKGEMIPLTDKTTGGSL